MARALAFALLLLAGTPLASSQQGVGDVVFVPTPQVVVDAMLRMADVGRQDYLIDLGSGDGRVVISAAHRGARALGVDLDRVLLERATNAAKSAGVAERATFREQNLFETDLAGATVISTYLLPEMNLKLRPKLLDLPPGTRIVAHDYHMGSWLPDQRATLSVPEKQVGTPGVSHVYLWYVPARVAGHWKTQLPVGNAMRGLEFEVEQRFQALTARVQSVGGRAARIQTATLRGDWLTFDVEVGPGRPPLRYEFAGQVVGDALRGTVSLWENNTRREQAFTARRVAAGVAAMN